MGPAKSELGERVHQIGLAVICALCLLWISGCAAAGNSELGHDTPGPGLENEVSLSEDGEDSISDSGVDEDEDGGDRVDLSAVFEGKGCSHLGFVSNLQRVEQNIPGQFVYTAERSHEGGADLLEITLRHGGVYGAPRGPGTVGMGGTTFETCDTCVRLFQNCSSSRECEKAFFGTAGSLEISRWDDMRFEATFDSLVLSEVNINNPIAIMPKLNGDLWCLHGEALQVDTSTDTGPLVADPVCVAEGKGDYLGHNIKNFTLENCLGEEVSLHGSCGQSRALWIFATTGWCAACATILNSMAAEYGGNLSRKIIGEVSPGLDMLVVLSQDKDYGEPDYETCLEYAESHNLDPAMLVLDHTSEGVEIPMIDPIGETHSYEGMATTWTHINPYLIEENGGVQNLYPWNALLRGSNMEYFWSDNCGVSNQETALEMLLAE